MSRSQKKFAALGAVAGLVTVGAAVKHRFGKREVVDGSTSLTVGDWKVVLNETRLALRSKNLPTLILM